jgi:hypothetical protein
MRHNDARRIDLKSSETVLACEENILVKVPCEPAKFRFRLLIRSIVVLHPLEWGVERLKDEILFELRD